MLSSLSLLWPFKGSPCATLKWGSWCKVKWGPSLFSCIRTRASPCTKEQDSRLCAKRNFSPRGRQSQSLRVDCEMVCAAAVSDSTAVRWAVWQYECEQSTDSMNKLNIFWQCKAVDDNIYIKIINNCIIVLYIVLSFVFIANLTDIKICKWLSH